MNILNKLKWNGACLGLCLAASMFWSRSATAEVTLVDKDGWTFYFDGRINAFLSGGKGDDLPSPTPNPDPAGPSHVVQGGIGSGADGPGAGKADVGWPGSYGQQDKNNKYLGVRVRSGMFGNILGFGIARQLTETTRISGYLSLWSTVESLGRDKWSPLPAEAREGYFKVRGNWGTATVGRTLGWLGRMSYEIDVAYGHGYGVGLPCTDSLGPSCGHIGTGVLFPGYSAGMSYSTPSLGGLQVHAGLYDPIVLGDWLGAPLARPEGAITFDRPIGARGRIKLEVEGLYQPLSRVNTDPTTGAKSDKSTSVWGASGGIKFELGPVRIGAAAFRGRGVGLSYALQRSSAVEDGDSSHVGFGVCIDNDGDPATPCVPTLSYQLRTFTGYYGQGALVFSRVQLAGGYGVGTVDQLPVDKLNPQISVIRYQAGISGAVYFFVTDSVVLGLDYFRFMAGWYGAPIVDPMTMQATGQHLASEKQVLNFLNLGVTYHW